MRLLGAASRIGLCPVDVKPPALPGDTYSYVSTGIIWWLPKALVFCPFPADFARRGHFLCINSGKNIEPVWGGGTLDIDTTVQHNNAAGETEAYHAVLTRLDFGLKLAAGGNYLNFYGIDSMNMKNVWWDSTIVDTFTIFGDKLYVLSGDINYYDDYAEYSADLTQTVEGVHTLYIVFTENSTNVDWFALK